MSPPLLFSVNLLFQLSLSLFFVTLCIFLCFSVPLSYSPFLSPSFQLGILATFGCYAVIIWGEVLCIQSWVTHMLKLSVSIDSNIVHVYKVSEFYFLLSLIVVSFDLRLPFFHRSLSSSLCMPLSLSLFLVSCCFSLYLSITLLFSISLFSLSLSALFSVWSHPYQHTKYHRNNYGSFLCKFQVNVIFDLLEDSPGRFYLFAKMFSFHTSFCSFVCGCSIEYSRILYYIIFCLKELSSLEWNFSYIWMLCLYFLFWGERFYVFIQEWIYVRD